MRHPNIQHIHISDNVFRGRVLTRREIERNRQRLAAKIAQMQTGQAIHVPPGCRDLRELDTPIASIFPMEMSKMIQDGYQNGNGNSAGGEHKRHRHTDDEIRAIHAEYLEVGNMAKVAESHQTNPTTLRTRFQLLDLHIYPKGNGPHRKESRQPYSPPSVATLPVNGNGQHAEVAREMVAAVAVEAELGSDKLPPPKPEETAVAIAPPKKPAPPPDYRIMHMLIDYLPADGRWTLHERELWLDATHAVLRLCVKEVRP